MSPTSPFPTLTCQGSSPHQEYGQNVSDPEQQQPPRTSQHHIQIVDDGDAALGGQRNAHEQSGHAAEHNRRGRIANRSGNRFPHGAQLSQSEHQQRQESDQAPNRGDVFLRSGGQRRGEQFRHQAKHLVATFLVGIGVRPFEALAQDHRVADEPLGGHVGVLWWQGLIGRKQEDVGADVF